MKSKLNTYWELIKKSPYKIELIFWVGAFVYLALINPSSKDHLDLCLFRFIGFDACPGCGLGKSVSYVLHGDILSSLINHPLGIIAVILILFRIINLLEKSKNYYLTTKGVV